ncbi:MAG: hypothetical protein AAFY00_01410 [Bacteroidota bacterium]
MKKYALVCILFTSIGIFAQENPLSIFENLMNKTWFAEGNWGDGSKFKQEITFSYDLSNTLIIANSKGYTNSEQTEYGARNHGIRKYNPETNVIDFWEFDIFGGVTQGTVKTQGRNIIYTYSYGESIVTDAWEYVDENTYNFKVGNYANGQWEQVYLSTQFKVKAQ